MTTDAAEFLLGLEVEPMEAKTVASLPTEPGWQFEPKWDGFRCLAFKSGGRVELRSRSGKSMARYFPEMVEALATSSLGDVVLDGELVLPAGDTLSFGALQDRLHPAESRIRRLAVETPAQLMLFDCLAIAGSGSLLQAPLVERRAVLERALPPDHHAHRMRLSPCTTNPARAEAWLAETDGTLDGVVAKRLDGAYLCGKRAMLKRKHRRTADCVVGGFRYEAGGGQVGSLLLGLYDEAGRLDHVGFTSAIAKAERAALTERLDAVRGGPGFTGNAPGGPSRWATDRSADWQRLRPELVVEVEYDQVTDGRFRHGTMLLRWRPDKAPGRCTRDQLQQELRPALLLDRLDP